MPVMQRPGPGKAHWRHVRAHAASVNRRRHAQLAPAGRRPLSRPPEVGSPADGRPRTIMSSDGRFVRYERLWEPGSGRLTQQVSLAARQIQLAFRRLFGKPLEERNPPIGRPPVGSGRLRAQPPASGSLGDKGRSLIGSSRFVVGGEHDRWRPVEWAPKWANLLETKRRPTRSDSARPPPSIKLARVRGIPEGRNKFI